MAIAFMGIPTPNRSIGTRSAIIAVGLVVFLALSAGTFEIPPLPRSRAAVLSAHVKYLSSGHLTGRGVDTPGIDLARDYIAREFAKYGLSPGGDNGTFFQGFDLTTGVTPVQPTALAIGNKTLFNLNEDWTPLGLSGSGTVEAEMVFVGYGITANDHGYDDYAGIDATGKIVLVLRHEPPPKDGKSPFRKPPAYSNHATIRAKVDNARDHGAAAMLLVDLRQAGGGLDELIPLRRTLSGRGSRLIAAQIKQRMLDGLLTPLGISVLELKEKIDRADKPASVALSGLKAAITVTLEEARRRGDNVVGILPGSDPARKGEHIVIGAHYDHIGYGHFGARAAGTEGQIHHGADDNASGTAALLELAAQLSRSRPRPPTAVVFAAFSGEELGLHGSRHYVNHPPLPIASTKVMLNLDMVGRLQNNRLTVFGTRSAKQLSDMVNSAGRSLGIEASESDGIGSSDHMSFHNKKVPSLHFYTGTHSDYHLPSDTAEKVNAAGLAKITDLVTAVVRRITSHRDTLHFAGLPSPPASQGEGPRGYGAYLGSIPDYRESTQGVRLAGVANGSPAAFAGLRAGDVIVGFSGTKVENLADLALLLGNKKPGEEVELAVVRSGRSLIVKATLEGRSD